MDFILHCGAHRCATTSFQRALERSGAGLLAGGVVAWTPERARRGLLGGVLKQPSRVLPQHDRRAERAARDIAVERAVLERAGVPVLLLSEENAIGSILTNLRSGMLYPDLAARIARLRQAIPGPWRRIGLSIRRLDDYWTSCLSFGIAQGHPPPEAALSERLAAQALRRGWRHVAIDLACAAPEAEIVILPHENFAGRAEEQLSALLDGRAPPPLANDERRHNASPSATDLRRMLASRAGAGPAGPAGPAEPAGPADPAAVLPEATGRWTPFTEDQRRLLGAQYDEDLAWFAAGAGGLARIGRGRRAQAGQAAQAALAGPHIPGSVILGRGSGLANPALP